MQKWALRIDDPVPTSLYNLRRFVQAGAVALMPLRRSLRSCSLQDRARVLHGRGPLLVVSHDLLAEFGRGIAQGLDANCDQLAAQSST
jgi:hypothetical protein